MTFDTKTDLLKLDYILEGLKTLIDLVINGIYGLLYSLGSAFYHIEDYCTISDDYSLEPEVCVFLSKSN